MQVVLAEGFKSGQLRIIPVVFLGKRSGGLHDRIPLRGRKLPQLGCRPPSKRRHVMFNCNRGFSRF